MAESTDSRQLGFGKRRSVHNNYYYRGNYHRNLIKTDTDHDGSMAESTDSRQLGFGKRRGVHNNYYYRGNYHRNLIKADTDDDGSMAESTDSRQLRFGKRDRHSRRHVRRNALKRGGVHNHQF